MRCIRILKILSVACAGICGFLGGSGAAFAAVGNHIWSVGHSAGGTSACDLAGDTIVYGTFFGTVDFGGGPMTSVNALGGDVFLVRFDTSGNHVWSRQITPDGGLGVFDHRLAIDPSGGFYISGRLAGGTLDLGGGPFPGTQGFLAKFDPSGNFLWDVPFGQGRFTSLDANGTNVVGVGFTDYASTGVDFGGGLITPVGGYAMLVAQFTSAGAHDWSAGYGNSNDVQAYSVALDGSGNLFVVSEVSGTIDFGGGPLTSFITPNPVLVSFTPTGAHRWSQIFAGDFVGGFDLLVATGPSGQVAMCGQYRDTVNFGGGNITSNGFIDLFIAQFDNAGVHEWSAGYGTVSGVDRPDNVIIDAGGNVLFSGYCTQPIDVGGGTLSAVPGSFLALYDAGGSHLFSTAYPDGFIMDTDFAANGDIMVHGSASPSIDLGGGTITPADLFIGRLEGVANTPAGSSVVVTPLDSTTGHSPVTVTFDDVATAGSTTLVSSDAGPPPPGSLSFGDPATYYDISTSASFNANVEICIQYDETMIPGAEGDLTLQHYDDAIPAWVDVTTSRDEVNNVVCGTVTSLSPFALAVPAGPVSVPADVARRFVLGTIAPNPFNPSTSIEYEVPAGGGHVELSIYDVSGRLVRTLVDAVKPAGRNTARWDGRDVSGQRVASGVYFCRMLAAGFASSRKLALVE